MLVKGMVRVIKIDVKRIVEDCDSFIKRNSVFLKVTRRLFLVPLITHVSEYNTRFWKGSRSRLHTNCESLLQVSSSRFSRFNNSTFVNAIAD